MTPFTSIRSSLRLAAFAAMLLTSLVLPSLRAQGATATTVEGKQATFTVTVGSGTPPFTVVWKKATVANPTAVTIPSAPNALVYVITGLTVADTGLYSAVVSNASGSTTSDIASLTVTLAPIAPLFTTQPISASVQLGSPATFTVVASGLPAPTLQWYAGPTAIPGATSATLSIAAVTMAQNGLSYTCVATSSSGTVTSAAAILTVTPIKPANITLDVQVK